MLGLVRFAADDTIGYVAMRHRPSGVVVVLSTPPRRRAHGVRARPPPFAVPDRDVLEEWAAHLTRVGIDHPGVVLELGKPSLQLRDPDGNAIEHVAPAPQPPVAQ